MTITITSAEIINPISVAIAGVGIGAAQTDWNAISGPGVLLNKPTAVSAFTNDSGYLSSVAWSIISEKPTFSVVATSGSYTDLINQPTIITDHTLLSNIGTMTHAQLETAISLNTAKVSFDSVSSARLTNTSGTNTGDETASTIKTKLGITTLSGANTGDQDLSGYAHLTDIPTTLPASDVYPWAKQSTKPTYVWSEIGSTPAFSAVATSGSYTDLSNKPTIPSAQVQTDWNASTGLGVLLNKPNLSAMTNQGNTFNGASQLVQLGSDGKLPAIDGSLLTSLPSVLQFISSTSSYTLQTPDNTITGGNARGIGAVDLQTIRSVNTQVASGIRSVAMGYNNTASGDQSVAMGYNNTASGIRSVAMGSSNIASSSSSVAMGYNNTAIGAQSVAMGNSNNATGIQSVAMGVNNTASGTYSVAMGIGNTASGTYSVAMGNYGNTNGIASKMVLSVASGYQIGELGLYCITTTVTPAIATSTGSAALATNQCTLQNNNALRGTFEVIARDTVTGNTSAWSGKFAGKRGANASTTALVGTPVVTLDFADAGATWGLVGAITITADTTNGAIAFTVTGAAAITIHWMVKIKTTEVI